MNYGPNESMWFSCTIHSLHTVFEMGMDKFTCEHNEMRSTGYHIDQIVQISIDINALLLKVNDFVILTGDKFPVAQMPQFRAECFV